MDRVEDDQSKSLTLAETLQAFDIQVNDSVIEKINSNKECDISSFTDEADANISDDDKGIYVENQSEKSNALSNTL